MKTKYIIPTLKRRVMAIRGRRASLRVIVMGSESLTVPVRQMRLIMQAMNNNIDLTDNIMVSIEVNSEENTKTYHASHVAGIARKTQTFHNKHVVDLCAS
jgi:hypothetical protein